jgi:hypothetical protein
MLDLSTAVLCDFAQVRDRLLFVSSGAVSRLYRRDLPSPLGLMVGLVIEVPLEDSGVEHTLRADVVNRHGDALATVQNTFRVGDEGLFPHEVQQVPLVLSITGVRARTWGTHQVRLTLDDELMRALTLYIVPAAGVTPARPAAPRPQVAASAPEAAAAAGPDAEPVDAAEDTPEQDDTVIEMVDADDSDDAGPADEEVVISVGEEADATADDEPLDTAEADQPETVADDTTDDVAAADDADTAETADATPVADASDAHDDDTFVLVDDDHHDEPDAVVASADIDTSDDAADTGAADQSTDTAEDTGDTDDTDDGDADADSDSPSVSDDDGAPPAAFEGRRGRRGRRRK